MFNRAWIDLRRQRPGARMASSPRSAGPRSGDGPVARTRPPPPGRQLSAGAAAIRHRAPGRRSGRRRQRPSARPGAPVRDRGTAVARTRPPPPGRQLSAAGGRDPASSARPPVRPSPPAALSSPRSAGPRSRDGRRADQAAAAWTIRRGIDARRSGPEHPPADRRCRRISTQARLSIRRFRARMASCPLTASEGLGPCAGKNKILRRLQLQRPRAVPIRPDLPAH